MGEIILRPTWEAEHWHDRDESSGISEVFQDYTASVEFLVSVVC